MSAPSDALRKRLGDAIGTIPVIDVHSHLRSDKPAANSLADIILYHHLWIELVSAGMPLTLVTKRGLPHELAEPGIPAVERVRRALPFFHNIRQTTCAAMLRILLRDLYKVPDGVLTEDNYVSVIEKMESKGAGWAQVVFNKYCHIKTSLSVEAQHEKTPIKVGRSYATVIGAKVTSGARYVTSLEKASAGPITGAAALRQLIRKNIKEIQAAHPKFIGFSLPAYFDFSCPTDSEMDSLIKRWRRDESITVSDRINWTAFTVNNLLRTIRDTSTKTIQIMMGVEVYPPHRSTISCGSNLVNALPKLLCAYEDLHFNFSSASEYLIQPLAILAKHFPNVSVSGYWWHTLYPYYIKKSIETYLAIVPANKIIAFFSDAYHVEWCYPKLNLVKSIWSDILARNIEDGLYTEKLAVSLMEDVFYHNPCRIYQL